METAGVIAEFNPFHNGHELLLGYARENSDGVICAMSGNVVQRGDFAIIEKHSRAEAAVRCGADLVLELPLPWVLSSAEGFAEGGVGTLAATGLVTRLIFGSECGDAARLSRAADALDTPEFSLRLSEELASGISFAEARQSALEHLGFDDFSLLSEPNNNLGIEYIRALNRLHADIAPLSIARIGTGHDGKPNGRYASGSYLRELFDELAVSQLDRYIPADAMDIFYAELEAGRAPVFLADCDRSVLARLRMMTDAEFEALPDGSEGLWRRFMSAARLGVDLDLIMENTKTKRYALSRIRRMLMSAYLGLSAADRPAAPLYLRVLAFNRRGRELLHLMRESSALPVITKPAHIKKFDADAQRLFALEARATNLFRLAFPDLESSAGGQEYTIDPVYIDR